MDGLPPPVCLGLDERAAWIFQYHSTVLTACSGLECLVVGDNVSYSIVDDLIGGFSIDDILSIQITHTKINAIS